MLPAVPSDKFYKIRHRTTGLFKLAGFDWREYEDPRAHLRSVKESMKIRFPGWSATGKVWNRKQLAGHLGNFLRLNRPHYATGLLPRPELPVGADYYEIPECYEIVEFIATGAVVPLEDVLREGATVVPA